MAKAKAKAKIVKKAAPKKAAVKKVAPKKAAVKKAAPKKVAPKKVVVKKAAPKKVVAPKVFKAKAIKTKADLIKQVKDSAPALELSTKAANELIDNLFGILSISIKKNARFTVPGFGTFTVKKRKARTGRNPQTGEKIKIKAHKTVGFKPTPKLKEIL